MNRKLLLLPLCSIGTATLASAQQVEVLYTKIWTSSTGNVPGTLDAGGLPVASNWRAIEDFAVNPDGSDWILKGRTSLSTDIDTILVRGSGTAGTMFCQEGRPFQGGGAGEVYDFFDTPICASWDTAGNLGFGSRARGGVATDDEKAVRVVGGVHTVVIQQGSPLTGLVDVVANPSGDELLGNSFSSFLLDSGVMSGVNTPITNCHTSRYPAILHGNAAFRQSGVSLIGGEVWDSFLLDGAGGTPDGLHWFAEGDTENTNTSIDNVFVVDDAVVMREGSVVPGSALIYADTFQASMAPNGTWIARGDAAAPNLDDDWVVLNGTKLLQTGESVEGGAEAWSPVIGASAVNSLGDWAVQGQTNNANPALDYVIVVNGQVVLREGDPVDVNGNGLFDDDAFVGRGNNTLAAFSPFDMALTDDGYLYAIIQLRNGAGVDLNSTAPPFGTPDAFVRLLVGSPPVPYCFGDGSGTPCPCTPVPLVGDPDKGCPNGPFPGGGKLTASGLSSISNDTLVMTATTINNGGAVIFQGTSDNGGGLGTPFGDGLRCAAGSVRRMKSHAVTTNSHQYPDPMFGDNAISIRGAVLAPGDRWYQGWYRSGLAHCNPAENYNLTNGVKITWVL